MAKKSPQTRLAPIIMIVFGGLLILGGGAWYFNQMVQATDQIPTQAVILADDYPDIVRVSLVEAKDAFDTGSAIFLDVRDAQSYNLKHIPGARLISLSDLPDRIGELNPEDSIITY